LFSSGWVSSFVGPLFVLVRVFDRQSLGPRGGEVQTARTVLEVLRRETEAGA